MPFIKQERRKELKENDNVFPITPVVRRNICQ